MRTDPITPAEIAVLNAARLILDQLSAIDADGTPLQYYVAAFADVAGGAMFDYLNTANAYLDLHLTYEQLHNKAKPEPFALAAPEPEPAPADDPGPA